MDRKWGVFYRWAEEYATLEEAKSNLELEQMDVPAVLVYDDGAGWQNGVTGKFMEKHAIDELLFGGVFAYENPAFDWNTYIVSKYLDGVAGEQWWIEETRSLVFGHLQSCRMIRHREARLLFNKFNGRMGR